MIFKISAKNLKIRIEVLLRKRDTRKVMDKFITISIPKIKNTQILQKILSFSGEKLVKVMELGITVYESTENQHQQWDNTDFDKKIKDMELAQKEKEKQLNVIIDCKNRVIENIRREFKEKQGQLYIDIENKVSLNYQSQLLFKDETIKSRACDINSIMEELRELRSFNNSLVNTHNNMERERRDSLIKEHKLELQEVRDNTDLKLAILQNSLMSLHKIKDNSSIKGKIGEDKMKQILTMLFPKNEIEDTHATPGRGDFIITCKNDKKILIDNKDYSSNVPKKEIDKFEKDIRENNDVFGGVLISNSSGISKKDDFQLDIIDTKPVIYIHNTNKDSNKIKCGIELIESIICANHVDFQDKEICDKLSKISSEIKRKISKIKRDMDKHSKNIIETVLNIENLVKEVFLNTRTKY